MLFIYIKECYLLEDRNMRKLEDEYNWEGVAEDLAKPQKYGSIETNW